MVAMGQSGRVVRGTVVDIRDQPIPAVTLVIAGGKPVISDDSGRFQLEISHRERILIDVRRIGYMPSRVGFAAGGDTSISVFLLPSTQQMPGVEVMGIKTRPLPIAGFEQRMLERKRGAGAGHFITAKDIEASPSLRATQIVENIPSILVRRTSGDRFAIYGKSVGGGGECVATVYLDGVRVASSGELTRDRRGRVVNQRDALGSPIDQLVTPSEIAGVEVYGRGLFAPTQFHPPGDEMALRCAIVAYWTKHAS